MMKSMKKLSLMVAVAVMVVGLAAPAMADEAQDQRNDPAPVEEEPLKDPGIRLCDITPTACQDADDPPAEHGDNPGADTDADDPNPAEEEEPLKDPGIRLCDITPTACQDTDDEDSATHEPTVVCIKAPCPGDSSSPGEEEDRLKDPGIRLCDIAPTECEDADDSSNDHGYNSDDDPDADDPNPVEEEESSAPGAPKAGEASGKITTTAEEDDASAKEETLSAPDAAGQIANSPTVYGCPFDYEYEERWDTCIPSLESLDFYPILNGDKPWPDSFGGTVGLPGHLVGDMLIAYGAGLQIGLGHYVQDALVEFGEGGGPIGWGIQGLGYTLGFAGDTAGVILQGAGEVVGAVTDGAGAVVDAVTDNVVYPVLGGVVEGVEAVVESVEKVADVAKSTWKKISSWF